MSAPSETPNEQAKRWNGPLGQGWVEAKEILDRLFQVFEDRLVEQVPSQAPAAVLDVGCGTGSTTLAIARRLPAGGRALGIDISEPMIAAARTHAAREGSSARFVCANAEHYAFEPSSFDLILSRFGVMFFEDPVRAFTNLRAATREGGALCFIAWRSPAENPFMTAAERAAAPLLPGLPPRRAGEPGQFAFAEAERVRTLLGASGWSAIDIQPLDVRCTLAASDLDTYLMRLGPVSVALQEASGELRTRLLTAVRAGFEPYVHGAQVQFMTACWTVFAKSHP